MKTLPDEPYQLTQGPLPKSIFTVQLEEITRKLLMGRTAEFTIENQTNFVKIDGIKYNLTEIIQYANLDHIELNRDDLSLYRKHMQRANIPLRFTPRLEAHQEAMYRRALYSDYLIKNQCLPDFIISFQEMQAINIYTGEGYKKMNALLRGEFNFQSEKNSHAKEVIIQTVVCASGLRKMPETIIKEAYRGADMPSVEKHNERIKAVEKQGVIQLSGFVSTSIDPSFSFIDKPIHFHFKNLKGMYIAPISKAPHEKEFLIAPTHVQLTGYEFKNNTHCFEGQIASDLASVKAGSLKIAKSQVATLSTLGKPTNKPDIKTGRDVCNELAWLTLEQRANFYKEWKKELPGLFQSGNDFVHLMELLPKKQRVEVETNMGNFITSSRYFYDVMMDILPEQRPLVYEMMKTKLPSLIESGYDVGIMQKYLLPEQQKMLIGIKQLMDAFANTASNADITAFASALMGDNNLQINAQFNYLIAHSKSLPSLISALSNIKPWCLEKTNMATELQLINTQLISQRNIETGIKLHIAQQIKHRQNATELALQYLTPEQCTTVFNDMKDRVPYMIESGKAFGKMLVPLSPEQRKTVISIKRLMDSLVKTASDADVRAFASALMSENPEKIKTQFDHIIENTKHYSPLMTAITGLEPRWLNKINMATGLKLTDSLSAVEISALNKETGKAITQQYKMDIKHLGEDEETPLSKPHCH